jgi:DNA-binding transcriptional MerR regulator
MLCVSELLDIAEVVRRAGVPVSTLHVWERHGLIEPVARAGLRRQYDDGVLTRIAVIAVCQGAGFTLAEIHAVLAPDAFAGGKDLLVRKLDALLERRRQLDGAIDGLRHALDCPHASPFTCPTFAAELRAALPVRQHLT